MKSSTKVVCPKRPIQVVRLLINNQGGPLCCGAANSLKARDTVLPGFPWGSFWPWCTSTVVVWVANQT